MTFFLRHSDALLLASIMLATIAIPVLYFRVRARISQRRMAGQARLKGSGRIAPLEAAALSASALRALAEDRSAVVVCDWREEPDDVVTSVNGFLPATLRLTLSSDRGLAVVCGSRSAVLSDMDLDVRTEGGGVLNVIRAANEVLAPAYELRLVNVPDTSDSQAFLCASGDEWRACEAANSRAFRRTFSRVLRAGVA